MRTIELTPEQNSVFDVDIDSVRYTLDFRFNSRSTIWVIQLSVAGTVILSGVPAVIGSELFQGHAVEPVPRNLFMISVNGDGEDADFLTLGQTTRLILIEEGDNIDVFTI